jgi:hypothetical protein
MDLTDLIQSALRDGRFVVSDHARGRLRQRRIALWQVEAGVDDWIVLEERLQDLPNPSIVCEQILADGTTVTAIWAWNSDSKEALLVTVYFPDRGVS